MKKGTSEREWQARTKSKALFRYWHSLIQGKEVCTYSRQPLHGLPTDRWLFGIDCFQSGHIFIRLGPVERKSRRTGTMFSSKNHSSAKAVRDIKKRKLSAHWPRWMWIRKYIHCNKLDAPLNLSSRRPWNIPALIVFLAFYAFSAVVYYHDPTGIAPQHYPGSRPQRSPRRSGSSRSYSSSHGGYRRSYCCGWREHSAFAGRRLSSEVSFLIACSLLLTLIMVVAAGCNDLVSRCATIKATCLSMFRICSFNVSQKLPISGSRLSLLSLRVVASIHLNRSQQPIYRLSFWPIADQNYWEKRIKCTGSLHFFQQYLIDVSLFPLPSHSTQFSSCSFRERHSTLALSWIEKKLERWCGFMVPPKIIYVSELHIYQTNPFIIRPLLFSRTISGIKLQTTKRNLECREHFCRGCSTAEQAEMPTGVQRKVACIQARVVGSSPLEPRLTYDLYSAPKCKKIKLKMGIDCLIRRHFAGCRPQGRIDSQKKKKKTQLCDLLMPHV